MRDKGRLKAIHLQPSQGTRIVQAWRKRLQRHQIDLILVDGRCYEDIDFLLNIRKIS